MLVGVEGAWKKPIWALSTAGRRVKKEGEKPQLNSSQRQQRHVRRSPALHAHKTAAACHGDVGRAADSLSCRSWYSTNCAFCILTRTRVLEEEKDNMPLPWRLPYPTHCTPLPRLSRASAACTKLHNIALLPHAHTLPRCLLHGAHFRTSTTAHRCFPHTTPLPHTHTPLRRTLRSPTATHTTVHVHTLAEHTPCTLDYSARHNEGAEEGEEGMALPHLLACAAHTPGLPGASTLPLHGTSSDDVQMMITIAPLRNAHWPTTLRCTPQRHENKHSWADTSRISSVARDIRHTTRFIKLCRSWWTMKCVRTAGRTRLRARTAGTLPRPISELPPPPSGTAYHCPASSLASLPRAPTLSANRCTCTGTRVAHTRQNN